METDPNVAEEDDTAVYLDQQYPVKLHHSMGNYNKVHSSMKNVLSFLRWNKTEAKDLDPKTNASMENKQQDILRRYQFQQ